MTVVTFPSRSAKDLRGRRQPFWSAMTGAGDIPEPSAADARQAPPAARPLRLLVIDDDRDVADSLGMLMESFGAEVRVAYDGASGVEAAHEFAPEIICIDVHMPGIDGYETARRMRERLG